MKIILTIIFLLWLLPETFSQTTTCKFNLLIDEAVVPDNSYTLSRYSIRGTSKFQANIINIKLALTPGDNVWVNSDSLCAKINSVVIFQNLYLKSIEVFPDTSNGLATNPIMIRFKYEKNKKGK